MPVTEVRRVVPCACLAIILTAGAAAGQKPPDKAGPTEAAPAAAATIAADALGRTTPRGTVFGFLDAARSGDGEIARHYLNTPLTGDAAKALAHALFVVLDTRLPARLTQVSDAPEGSRANPLAPDEERVGRIDTANGPADIVVERVRRSGTESVWLFSRRTLAIVPGIYDEIEGQRAPRWLPRVLREWRIAGTRLDEWLALLLALPALYIVTILLNRMLTPLVRLIGRRLFPRAGDRPIGSALPVPARLLLVSVTARLSMSLLPLSLLVRQQIANIAAVVSIAALVWLLMLLGGWIEGLLIRRMPSANYSAAVSLLRVGRRIADVLLVVAGMLAMLRHFGVDPTPLLAGLGVGGLAVALAAQKTLENVIAGASLIFDQAVRVGDFLRVGTIEGTVEHIGLRSTRIRTMERTLVSVPNGQIANMSLETLSARDKFWFHHVVGLRYETTTAQMRLSLDGVRKMLARRAEVDGTSVRVRFLRLNTFSLDVEAFAYVSARDWAHFLEIQETLLLEIPEIVAAAGTEIAFPSQTMYLSGVGVNATTPQLPTPK
jgi:MscS family membrane protein